MPIVPAPSTTDLTFGDVVDRVYRDWLHGPDEQPVQASLTADLVLTATSFTLGTSSLTPDEMALLAVGTLIEVGYEQLYITAVTGSTLTVSRGRNGTTAAEHLDGAIVTLLPMWGRQTVLDAVLDEVPRLYPDLHATYTYEVVAASTFVEVPASVVTITRAWVQTGTSYGSVDGIQLLTDFPPSSTGKAVQLRGYTGKTVHLAYRGTFPRPSTPELRVTDLAVDEAWVQILCVGAAAALIASEDFDKATVEFVTRQLEAQQFPTGSGSRLRDSMLRYRQYLVEQARRTIRSTDSTAIVRNDATYVG
jgi:hypothetical protein